MMTDNRITELLPCPFCGSGWLYETRRVGYCDDTPTMFCNSCKAIVTWEQVEEEGVNDETKAFVREHWNTRAAMEFDNWFYLPKPKEQIVEVTETTHAWDGAKGKTDVFYRVQEQAVINWAKELDEYIIKRICDVWNPERTCRIEGRYGNQYCTCCGEMVGTWDSTSELYIDGNMVELWNYCPNCGAKVVE